MYYPLPFDELLEECEYRVASISQVDKWLKDQADYYDWCSTIWQLTELERASEEYAFTCIYERLSELNTLHKMEPQIRAIIEEYPGGGPENPEVWVWYKKHEKFYNDHLLFFEPDHQNYEYHMLGQRHDLTVPMACFRENEIYLDKEDFTFVFDLVEIYEPLMYTPVPDTVRQNPAYADFFHFLENDPESNIAKAREMSEEESQLEEEDIIGKSALQKLRYFHETMVDVQELEEWVEEHAHVIQRLEDDHGFTCGCGICNDFKPLWHDMVDIINAYNKKGAYRTFLADHEASEKNPESLATLFLKYYPLIQSLRLPETIKDVAPGIVSYENSFVVIERFRFVFEDEPWNEIYKDLPMFTGFMNALYFYLLDRFNEEHKSFYLRYDFKKICQYFGDTLIDEASFFFDLNYELVVKFPHILTPEGKFVD